MTSSPRRSGSGSGSVTDVPGIRVGHWTEERARTGCTVLLFDGEATAGVSVRGGAPGTRETDLLDPVRTNERVDAIVLSGGSAYGLATADGVMRWLEERGIGRAVANAIVPIVPAAIVFDLAVGDPTVRPGPDQGYAACEAATAGTPAEGRVGAGTGATVGKLMGRELARPGGIGTAARRVGDITIGALFVVNAVGDVVHEDATLVNAPPGTPRIIDRLLAGERPVIRTARESTTIGVVATDATLTKTEASWLASVAQDGVARAVLPAHSRADGDTVFACSTLRGPRVDLELLGAVAVEVSAEAIRRAVR
ncbi:MAG: P1 family peptidase [Chloroflexi bacterium]|nr:P1 family peptidase [Chloroflexota bacterium]